MFLMIQVKSFNVSNFEVSYTFKKKNFAWKGNQLLQFWTDDQIFSGLVNMSSSCLNQKKKSLNYVSFTPISISYPERFQDFYTLQYRNVTKYVPNWKQVFYDKIKTKKIKSTDKKAMVQSNSTQLQFNKLLNWVF